MKVVVKEKKWAGNHLNFFHYYLDDNRIYEVCSRSKNPDVKEKMFGDAISIIAFNEDKSAVCLVHEYRPAIEGYCWAFPAGLREPGESTYGTAERELFEETGLKVVEFGKILDQSFQSPGITDESVETIVVTASGEPTNKNETEHEDIKPMWVTKDEARRILLGGWISARCQMFLAMWCGLIC